MAAKKKASRSMPTKTCVGCGASIHAATRTCKKCGAEQPQKKAAAAKKTTGGIDIDVIERVSKLANDAGGVDKLQAILTLTENAGGSAEVLGQIDTMRRLKEAVGKMK